MDRKSQKTSDSPRQGQKCMRGVPILYPGEIKKPVSFGLTPTGHEGIRTLAQDMGITMSELIEKIGRKQIEIIAQQPSQDAQDIDY